MKKIIVPVDFSDCSVNAVRYAVSFAKLMNAQLIVIYVHTPDVIVNATPVWQPYIDVMPLPKIVHEQMATIKTLVKEKGVGVTTYITEGTLNDSIIELAQEKHADLVIMGTESIDYGYNSFWGSHTSDLIGEKKIPVLVIPANYKANLVSNAAFVFATDFKGTDFIPEFFIELTKTLKASIHVFYGTERNPDEENKAYEAKEFEYIKEIFIGSSVSLNHTYKENLVEAVEEFTSTTKSSLLLMIAHKRGFLDNLFHKSVTKEMALHTSVPFLAIPDEIVELTSSVSNSGFIG